MWPLKSWAVESDRAGFKSLFLLGNYLKAKIFFVFLTRVFWCLSMVLFPLNLTHLYEDFSSYSTQGRIFKNNYSN